ncbi:MAG TPA: glycosyltransferase, partial [Vicinamibacterales bacterium]|nr:glycosyltransferase [Vicinamibacterales bacterium]
MTRLSVLMPVRNGMPYLPEAVGGILAQTFNDFELLVINNGSTDGTIEYLRTLRDPRLRVLSPGDIGLARSLNIGLAQAKGRYVARHDADDRSTRDRFAKQVAFLDANPGIAVLGTCVNFVDEHGDEVKDQWTQVIRDQQDPAQTPEQILAMMPLTCCIAHGSVMMRTAVALGAGGYNPATVPAEDYDLWLRLLPDYKIAKLPDRLYDYRVHGDQSSGARRSEQQARTIEAKLRYVRRQVPELPRPVRLVLPCDNYGATLFRRFGPAQGYDPSIRASAVARGTDVVAVTDFSAIPYYQ